MHDKTLTIPLDLTGVLVLAQVADAHGHPQEVVAPQHPFAICPRYVQPTPKLHEVWRCTMADDPLGQRRITLILLRRRFRERLAHEAQHQTVQHVAATSGVSPTTVRRAVTESVVKLGAAPVPTDRKLGLDEFAIRTGQSYATGLHDLERRRLVEVVEGRTRADGHTALERLRDKDRVEVVSMDTACAFRDAVQLVLPEAANLVTIHSVKGLDFPVIFLVGPNRAEFGGGQYAESSETLRALYVALTRVSENLTILVVDGLHHRLLERLDDQCYQAEGTRGREFVNLRGMRDNVN